MKLSTIILENKKYVLRKELNITEDDIKTIAGVITEKLDEYIDVGNQELLKKTVFEAINELVEKK